MIRSIYATKASEQRARVWLNGVDVSMECLMAIADEPDESGAVLLYTRNPAGDFFIDRQTGTIAREWKYGRVEIQEIG